MIPRSLDWSMPIDVDRVLSAVPADMTTKGLFFTDLNRRAEKAGAPRLGRWVAFDNYPVRDYAALLVKTARTLHPHRPLAEALYRVGETQYGTFSETTLGKVVFAFAGRDPKAALRLAPRAYHLISSGTVEVSLDEGTVDVLKMRRFFSFPPHEIGVLEGGLRCFGAAVEVRYVEHEVGAFDLHIHWGIEPVR